MQDPSPLKRMATSGGAVAEREGSPAAVSFPSNVAAVEAAVLGCLRWTVS